MLGSADSGVNLLENGFLLLPHVGLAMFPVKVGDDGSSDDQATQERQIEGATVAILHFARTSLLGNGNDMWVSRRSELSCGCSDRSSRDRSRRSRPGGGWRRGWLVGNEAATDDRRKAWHESSTRGEHFGSGRRRRKLLRQLCES